MVVDDEEEEEVFLYEKFKLNKNNEFNLFKVEEEVEDVATVLEIMEVKIFMATCLNFIPSKLLFLSF